MWEIPLADLPDVRENLFCTRCQCRGCGLSSQGLALTHQERARRGFVDSSINDALTPPCPVTTPTTPSAGPGCARRRPVRRQPLCPSCQAHRSSVGKGQPPRPLPPGPNLDVLERIATARERAGRRRPTSQPQSPRPAKPGHHGRRSGPPTRRLAKPHSNASRASVRESTKGPIRILT